MNNTIRITSGKFRGRKISTPGGKTHPMGERERLALFNMISAYIPGAVVLDAFAGSGALGIETLSRGAKNVVFIDNCRAATNVINANLKELDLESLAKVISGDVDSITRAGNFDIIMADPPYDNFEVNKVQYLAQFLNEDGVFVLSHPGEAPDLQGLLLQNSRKYANATISIYRKA